MLKQAQEIHQKNVFHVFCYFAVRSKGRLEQEAGQRRVCLVPAVLQNLQSSMQVKDGYNHFITVCYLDLCIFTQNGLYFSLIINTPDIVVMVYVFNFCFILFWV